MNMLVVNQIFFTHDVKSYLYSIFSGRGWVYHLFIYLVVSAGAIEW